MVVLFDGLIPYILGPLAREEWMLIGKCCVSTLIECEAVEVQVYNIPTL